MRRTFGRHMVAAAVVGSAAVLVLAGGAAPSGRGASSAVRPELPRSLVGREWETLPTMRRVVALTFDACGDSAGLERIERGLAARGAPATFFVCGRWAARNADAVRRLARSYALGNHTLTHRDLTALGDADVRAELDGGRGALARLAGVDVRPLLRFPYGARDARTIRLANAAGYGGIRWSTDTLGWKGRAGGQTAQSVLARVDAGLRPGAIVLMHVGAAPDGSTLDADALQSVLARIRARGYALADVVRYAARYVDVADDGDRDFRAPGWQSSAWNPGRHGAAYRFARPSTRAAPARFRLAVPQTAAYVVSAWWPGAAGYNGATPIGVETAGGLRWVRVDQRRGAQWRRLGEFRLRAGPAVVRVSRAGAGSGFVVADAVRITSPTPPRAIARASPPTAEAPWLFASTRVGDAVVVR